MPDLGVVLDAFSRRAIGLALGCTLEELAVTALRMALIERQPAPGLVHHSDRGVQYASNTYAQMLHQHATSSMSRGGNPYDNGSIERAKRSNRHTSTTSKRPPLASFMKLFRPGRFSFAPLRWSELTRARVPSAAGVVPEPPDFARSRRRRGSGSERLRGRRWLLFSKRHLLVGGGRSTSGCTGCCCGGESRGLPESPRAREGTNYT